MRTTALARYSLVITKTRRANGLGGRIPARPERGHGNATRCGMSCHGCWSRQLSDEPRLVYLVDGDDLVILQAGYHQ